MVHARRFLPELPRLRDSSPVFAGSRLPGARSRPVGHTARSGAHSYPAPTADADDGRSHRKLPGVCDSALLVALEPRPRTATRGWVPTAAPGPLTTRHRETDRAAPRPPEAP